MLRRLFLAVVVLFIVSVVLFGMLHALPGGLVRVQLGPRASHFAVQQLTIQEGLNKPLVVQFGVWAWNAVQGNLGFAYKLNEPVGTLLGLYLPRTLLLVGTALFLAIAIAVPLGIWQGYRRNRPDDYALSSLMLIFYAMPPFLLGVIFIVVFSIWTNVFPSTATNFGNGTVADLQALALPVFTLCLTSVSAYSRYMRSSTIDNLLSDYVRTALAEGASTMRMLMRHVLRNSLISIVTLFGLTLPFIVSGALIIEQLFNYPGMGLLFWNAAQQRDFPVLLGVTLVVTFVTVVGNLHATLTRAREPGWPSHQRGRKRQCRRTATPASERQRSGNRGGSHDRRRGHRADRGVAAGSCDVQGESARLGRPGCSGRDHALQLRRALVLPDQSGRDQPHLREHGAIRGPPARHLSGGV
jgi:peptide/nickel transport system permease protein